MNVRDLDLTAAARHVPKEPGQTRWARWWIGEHQEFEEYWAANTE